MATIGEANDINTVLHYFLGKPRRGSGVPTTDKARAAAERLADRSHDRLHAGLRAVDVAKAWRQLARSPLLPREPAAVDEPGVVVINGEKYRVHEWSWKDNDCDGEGTTLWELYATPVAQDGAGDG